MDFFKKLLKPFSERRLRFDITTIFTLLLASTSFFIITYTYFRIHKSILNFAEVTINRAGQIILENVSCFNKEYQEIPQACDSLIVNLDDLSSNNKGLLYYLERKLSLHPIVFSIYFGTTGGDFFNMENVNETKQTTMYMDSTKPIPKNTSYVIESIKATSNPQTRIRQYVDRSLTVLAEESIFPIDYDPRIRPWYQGAMESLNTYWTAPYKFVFPPVNGVTVSSPFYKENGSEILGVCGVDLTLESISNFIQNQYISKNGKAYIIDKATGEVILPLNYNESNDSSIHRTILKDSFNRLGKNTKKSFVQEFQEREYLISIFNMTESFNNRWLVAVMAPLDDFFFELFKTQKFVIVISLGIFLLSSFLVVVFSQKISKPITIIANEVDKITRLDFINPVRIRSNIKEIRLLDSSVTTLREAMQSFSKYVPKDIVKNLIKQGKGISLGGEKKQIVIMFSDIENFTPIAEKYPADTLMNLLAEYFDPVSKIILESQGTIDKYIGDSIMAFWGAPEEIPNPWIKACSAALKCQHLLNNFNKERTKNNLPPFPTRFGIAFGQAVVGNIGTEERINYTALGDVVNTAARLQSINKNYHTSILITEDLRSLIEHNFVTRPIDVVQVKGKETKIKIYELVAEKSQDPQIGATTLELKNADLFTSAYEAKEAGRIDEAIKLFEEVLKNDPEDMACKTWLQKLTK